MQDRHASRKFSRGRMWRLGVGLGAVVLAAGGAAVAVQAASADQPTRLGRMEKPIPLEDVRGLEPAKLLPTGCSALQPSLSEKHYTPQVNVLMDVDAEVHSVQISGLDQHGKKKTEGLNYRGGNQPWELAGWHWRSGFTISAVMTKNGVTKTQHTFAQCLPTIETNDTPNVVTVVWTRAAGQEKLQFPLER